MAVVVRDRFAAWLDGFTSIIDRSDLMSRVINGIGTSILFSIACLIFVNVFLRYLFSRPIPGDWELIELMMVVVVFFGVAYTYFRKGHVRIDIVVKRLSWKVQTLINIITCFLSISIFLLIIWQSVIYSLGLKAQGITTGVLGFPVYTVSLLIPFGCALLLIFLVRDFLNHLADGMRLFGLGLWLTTFGILASLVLLGILVCIQPGLYKLNPLTTGIGGLLLLLLLFFFGVPVGFAMLMVGFLGVASLRGIDAGLVALGSALYRTTASYRWASLPLFILMGFIVFYAELGKDLYSCAYKWIGHRKGGLAMATIAACAAFAAVVGDTVSATVAMGATALPEMKKYKYDSRLAVGSTAAAGVIGQMIPPSIGFIVYGTLTNESIGDLFIAGIIPGLLLAALFGTTVYIQCRYNPKMGPAGPKTNFKDKLVSLKATWPVLALFLTVVGGIYAGLFTPTEGGGIGVVGSLIIGLSLRRFDRQKFIDSLVEAGRVIAMLFIILGGAMIFSQFLALSKLPFSTVQIVTGLPAANLIVLPAFLILLLILGSFIPAIPMLILTLPIFFPTIKALGYDLIWFGVIMVIMLDLAVLSPPFGINCFAIAGISKEPIGIIYRGVLPFIIAELICVVILISFPEFATFLPNLMKGWF